MKKVTTLFARNHESDMLVRNEVVPAAEWVINGEGIATRKYDGTSCLIKDGKFYKRYDVKRGRKEPSSFLPAQEPDAITGHWPGWVPVGKGSEDRWHNEGLENLLKSHEGRVGTPLYYLEVGDLDGTYELCGPKVQGNPENLAMHYLIPHAEAERLDDAPRDFDGLKEYLASRDIEGIVWHHPDGRMAKIKKKDFGFKR